MAFNEASSIEPVVHELRATLEEMGKTYELVIVDDGSTDNTPLIVDQLVTQYPHLYAIHHPANLGLGSVYRYGFFHTQGEYLTFFPADGQFPADILKQFYPLTVEADLILGYLPHQDRSLVANLLSRGEKMLYYCLFGHLPPFKGVMLIRRSTLAEVDLKSQGRGWGIVMELIIRASRGPFRIISVPTEIRPRMSGRSKVRNLTTILTNFKQAIALRLIL